MALFNIMDGAMGSELIRNGLILPEYTWSANINIFNPEMVKKIHRENIAAGADFITTNTFRTTPRAYMKTGADEKTSHNLAKDAMLRAVTIAQDAANDSTKIIGSIAPLEDCYSPNLFPGNKIAAKEYSQLGKWFTKAKVDILLLETMNSIAESEVALHNIENYNVPIWISFVLKDDRHLLSGDSIFQAIKMVKDYSVDCVLLNCNPIGRTLSALKNIVANWPYKWGVYPNLGVGEPSSDGNILHYETMDYFLSTMAKIIEMEPFIVGACCGSTSRHISMLHELRGRCELAYRGLNL